MPITIRRSLVLNSSSLDPSAAPGVVERDINNKIRLALAAIIDSGLSPYRLVQKDTQDDAAYTFNFALHKTRCTVIISQKEKTVSIDSVTGDSVDKLLINIAGSLLVTSQIIDVIRATHPGSWMYSNDSTDDVMFSLTALIARAIAISQIEL